jgi:hypothetical protein
VEAGTAAYLPVDRAVVAAVRGSAQAAEPSAEEDDEDDEDDDEVEVFPESDEAGTDEEEPLRESVR